jgi:hypothetical protein
MKILFPLFLMPFLCVKCCPWDDCEGDDEPVCTRADTPAFSEITLASIPYADGESINYTTSSGTTLSTVTTRQEIYVLNQRGNCERRLEFTLQSTDNFNLINVRGQLRGDSLAYRYILRRGTFSEVAIVDVGIDQGPDDPGMFLIRQEGQRIVADTMLAGGAYQDVLVSHFPFNDAYETVYYTRAEGFVQFDIITGARIFLTN